MGEDGTKRKSFDFSIENLLKIETTSKQQMEDFVQVQDREVSLGNDSSTFSWLNCTRFKPPKLPRSKKRGLVCKRLGRGPRIPFSPQQISVLESTFATSQYLSSDSITRLANVLHLGETRVKIWFQNRRARFRRENSAGQCEIPPPLKFEPQQPHPLTPTGNSTDFIPINNTPLQVSEESRIVSEENHSQHQSFRHWSGNNPSFSNAAELITRGHFFLGVVPMSKSIGTGYCHMHA